MAVDTQILFEQALDLLNIKYVQDGTTYLLERDSMAMVFPYVPESDVYDVIYTEIRDFIGCAFNFRKLDDDYFVANFLP